VQTGLEEKGLEEKAPPGVDRLIFALVMPIVARSY
jgi:hypothetical protein